MVQETGGVTFCFMGGWRRQPGNIQRSAQPRGPDEAALYFVVENNGVAMGTQVDRSSAEHDLAQRACGYAMPHYTIDGNDLDVTIAEFTKAKERAGRGEGPTILSPDTFRFRGHSMSDR